MLTFELLHVCKPFFWETLATCLRYCTEMCVSVCPVEHEKTALNSNQCSRYCEGVTYQWTYEVDFFSEQLLCSILGWYQHNLKIVGNNVKLLYDSMTYQWTTTLTIFNVIISPILHIKSSLLVKHNELY